MVKSQGPDPLRQRVLLEFDAGGDGERVTGVARIPEDAAPQRFSGWLDLMRLLEAVGGRQTDDVSRAEERR